MGQKADFIGIFTIDTDAKRDACLAAANNRGQDCFNTIAPYGSLIIVPPLNLSQMKQVYTLNEAAVEAVLAGTGARGNEFLTALSGEGSVVVLNPVVVTPEPNVYTFENSWPAGTQLNTMLEITDSVGDVDTHVVLSTLPPGGPYTPEQAAAVVCGDIDAQAFVTCTQSGATLTLSATEAGTTLVSSMALA